MLLHQQNETNWRIKMKSIEIRFGKATRGNTAERNYIFSQLLQVESQINSAVVSGKEPMCGLAALREVANSYVKDIKELSK